MPLSGADLIPNSGTPQYFTNGNPGASIPATVWPAYIANMLVSELRNIVLSGRLSPSGSDWGQCWQAILGISSLSDTGTANTMIASFPLAPTQPFTTGGFIVNIKPNATNTGATTLTLNGGSAIQVVHPDGSALAAGELVNGYPVFMRYVLSLQKWTVISGSPTQQAPISTRRGFFTGSGSFTVPGGVTQVEVTVIGGGGGGGATNNSTAGGTIIGNAGAGGGGGGYAFKLVSGLTPGQVIVVTVGAGGASQSNTFGGNGGTSSFGAFCSAGGGTGGSFGSATIAIGGSGGVGAGGDFNIPGSIGGSSGTNDANFANQSEILNIFTKGGMAAGGYSTLTMGGTGGAGQGFGAGGSGASGGSGLAGGAGAPGAVLIRW